AEREKAKADMMKAALSVQTAQANAMRAQALLKTRELEAQTSKEKGGISLQIERTRALEANTRLDIERAKLNLLRLGGGRGAKTPPAAMTKQMEAAKQAEDLLQSLVDQGASHFNAEDSQKLQTLLRQAGATTLATTLPNWFLTRYWSGTKDIQSLLGSVQSYKP